MTRPGSATREVGRYLDAIRRRGDIVESAAVAELRVPVDLALVLDG
ncbi:MAG TPA: hypothetical protein VMD59_21340 [Acidimicrobiales bacterium]|nr:hypothetical protein [Acidimicrobiales bacterium]